MGYMKNNHFTDTGLEREAEEMWSDSGYNEWADEYQKHLNQSMLDNEALAELMSDNQEENSMKAPKSEGGSNFEKHPTGWALLVCTRLIDQGTHFNEKKQKDERKLMIGFESEKLMKEGDYAGQPFLVFSNFNYSMYQNSHLCGFIEDWAGKRFPSQADADNYDLSTLIGKKAFANIVHSEDGKYVNIQTIGPVPEGMTPPEIKGETILIDQDDFKDSEVAKLSERMREKVLSAKERSGVVRKKIEEDDFEDSDIPF